MSVACKTVVEQRMIQKRLSHVLSVSQVFMLDTQCSPKTPNNKDGFEHAQSCVLIIELPADQQSNGHAQKRWTLVSLTDACFNSLTPNQISLLVLTDILSSWHIASGFLLNPNQCLLQVVLLRLFSPCLSHELSLFSFCCCAAGKLGKAVF